MRKFWIPLIIVAVLVGVYLALAAVWGGKAKAARAAWTEAGHPLTIEELDAAYTGGSESTAAVVREAAGLVTDQDRQKLALLDSVGYNSNADDAKAFLTGKAQLYELVMRIASMPPADFGTDVRDGIGARIFERLNAYPAFRQVLRLKAEELAAEGRPDSALKVLTASVALSKLFAEPMAIYNLVSLLNLDSACVSAGRIEARAGIPAIEALVVQLEGLDFKAALGRSIECEMALTSYSLKNGSFSQMDYVPKSVAILMKTLRPLRDYAEARTLDLARRDLEVLPKRGAMGAPSWRGLTARWMAWTC
jgi:hypothetical protein